MPRLVSWNLSGLTATFTCLMASEPVVIEYRPLAMIVGWRLGLISIFKEKYCAITILTTDRMPCRFPKACMRPGVEFFTSGC